MTRTHWMLLVLLLSLSVNAGLLFLVVHLTIDQGHVQADQASTWRAVTAERKQLKEMRARFCISDPRPARADLLSWESQTRPADVLSEPHDKEGLLWLRDLAVKLDEDGRLSGVCSFMTWQTLDNRSEREFDNAGKSCPLEPLC